MLLLFLMDKCSCRHCGCTHTLQTSIRSQDLQSGAVSECCCLCTWTPICPPSPARSTSGAFPWEPPLGKFRVCIPYSERGPDPIFMLLSVAGLWLSRPQCSSPHIPTTPSHMLVFYFRTQCSSRGGGGGGVEGGWWVLGHMTHNKHISACVCVCGGNKWTEWTGGTISGHQLHSCWLFLLTLKKALLFPDDTPTSSWWPSMLAVHTQVSLSSVSPWDPRAHLSLTQGDRFWHTDL